MAMAHGNGSGRLRNGDSMDRVWPGIGRGPSRLGHLREGQPRAALIPLLAQIDLRSGISLGLEASAAKATSVAPQVHGHAVPRPACGPPPGFYPLEHRPDRRTTTRLRCLAWAISPNATPSQPNLIQPDSSVRRSRA